MRELHVAGDHQHHHVAGAQTVVRRHWPRQEGLELSGAAPEHVEAEEFQLTLLGCRPRRRWPLWPSFDRNCLEALRPCWRCPQSVERLEHFLARLRRSPLAGVAQIRVKQSRWVARSLEARSDLLGAQARLPNPLPHKLLVAAQQVGRLLGSLSRGRWSGESHRDGHEEQESQCVEREAGSVAPLHQSTVQWINI